MRIGRLAAWTLILDRQERQPAYAARLTDWILTVLAVRGIWRGQLATGLADVQQRWRRTRRWAPDLADYRVARVARGRYSGGGCTVKWNVGPHETGTLARDVTRVHRGALWSDVGYAGM